MPIPTPYLIGWRQYFEIPDEDDEHGQPINGWRDPVPCRVFGVSPRFREEPDDPNRYQVIEGLSVYSPKSYGIQAYDKVLWPFVPGPDGVNTVEGILYNVDGPVADWTTGPWPNPAAGFVIYLEDVKG